MTSDGVVCLEEVRHETIGLFCVQASTIKNNFPGKLVLMGLEAIGRQRRRFRGYGLVLRFEMLVGTRDFPRETG